MQNTYWYCPIEGHICLRVCLFWNKSAPADPQTTEHQYFSTKCIKSHLCIYQFTNTNVFGKVPGCSARQIYKRRRLFYGRRQQPGSLPQRWEPRPLRLFLEDISIIASLFNCEPRNTRAEVMSPSLVAEYHLFARGCMENASWLEVLFSYFVAEMQQRSWSSLSFFFFFFILIILNTRFKIQAANVSARSSRLQAENSRLIIQAPVHQNVQLEVVEKKHEGIS